MNMQDSAVSVLAAVPGYRFGTAESSDVGMEVSNLKENEPQVRNKDRKHSFPMYS